MFVENNDNDSYVFPALSRPLRRSAGRTGGRPTDRPTDKPSTIKDKTTGHRHNNVRFIASSVPVLVAPVRSFAFVCLPFDYTKPIFPDSLPIRSIHPVTFLGPPTPWPLRFPLVSFFGASPFFRGKSLLSDPRQSSRRTEVLFKQRTLNKSVTLSVQPRCLAKRQKRERRERMSATRELNNSCETNALVFKSRFSKALAFEIKL